MVSAFHLPSSTSQQDSENPSRSQNPPVAPTSLRIKLLFSLGSTSPIIPQPQLLLTLHVSSWSAHHCYHRAIACTHTHTFSWAPVAPSFHSDVSLQMSPLQSDLPRAQGLYPPSKAVPPPVPVCIPLSSHLFSSFASLLPWETLIKSSLRRKGFLWLLC